jgi:N utilization substance protein B
VLQQRLEETPLPGPAADFARRLVFGVLQHRALLDPFIQQHAPEWPLEQMACIDRNVLRLALYEFAVDGSTPVKVAINEAVELAKMFGSDSSPRFVNGVLGALVPLKREIARQARASQRSEKDTEP